MFPTSCSPWKIRLSLSQTIKHCDKMAKHFDYEYIEYCSVFILFNLLSWQQFDVSIDRDLCFYNKLEIIKKHQIVVIKFDASNFYSLLQISPSYIYSRSDQKRPKSVFPVRSKVRSVPLGMSAVHTKKLPGVTTGGHTT